MNRLFHDTFHFVWKRRLCTTAQEKLFEAMDIDQKACCGIPDPIKKNKKVLHDNKKCIPSYSSLNQKQIK